MIHALLSDPHRNRISLSFVALERPIGRGIDSPVDRSSSKSQVQGKNRMNRTVEFTGGAGVFKGVKTCNHHLMLGDLPQHARASGDFGSEDRSIGSAVGARCLSSLGTEKVRVSLLTGVKSK